MSHVYKNYRTWSASVRWFHWINVLSVMALIFVGLIMLYKKELGITSLDAKIGLKELHVIIGYIFATNLFIRIIFAFIGPASARFSAFIPGKGFRQNLQRYRESLKSGKPQQFIGHNPLGKLAVTALFTLLIILAISGLIRAGTDIYYPPFGSTVASYIAEEGIDPATLMPYQKEGVNPERMASLKTFKSPFGKIHLYTAYLLMLLIVIHIAAVVRAEVKEGDRLISSMFSGNKVLTEKPQDE
ncbi:MAG: cytochrome b/b6 domain-containing protein [gamma proteobacterium symbiont of Bathyaustriella thionipta]|nr:cytochrome b/b6 domain-containing protein [gamma proteobacterium symbiont of Bathyaustriella thionipta]MCU7951106.1 cytochrome b/b6 domain-containing protein [gamma proteobacterium symbiont of Bathyaustriella thionipta]MCU7951976.1 cytochrome b/b6 domain-containing protein [gamma proteobacterium symbiont of Bathyaustriella thionipta]MCU7957613.1 cytochrome b/b6 domain-containing protein [gamma proteobacterium symbiont of Bathyaustriella thionipta]MCU7968753.1 cytochrome b/b6 domain-containin